MAGSRIVFPFYQLTSAALSDMTPFFKFLTFEKGLADMQGSPFVLALKIWAPSFLFSEMSPG